MIRAEQAAQIMQRYEDDYDNFLDKLKAKRNVKRQKADEARSEADKAATTVAKAEARKPGHLKDKAKALLDKVGGIEGATSTAQNVIKYFKTDTPSDYNIAFGGDGKDNASGKEDFMKTFGISAVAVIAGGTLITIAVLYGLYRLVKKPAPAPTTTRAPLPEA